ncbi:Transcriptional regulator, HxlR family, partial [hydrothermal vent metagenome]
PIGGALAVFAGRWKPEILWHLKDQPLRFNQLLRAIGGVSQKMLTQQLRQLERDGLIIRTQYPQIPPRVEYTCTQLADSLSPIFEALETWNQTHRQSISKAQQTYDKPQKQLV